MSTKVKEKDENTIENATVINGVVLTEKAIEQLLQFQNESNSFLRATRGVISDAVCIIAQLIDIDTAKKVMTDLSYFRKDLLNLMKP